MSKLIGVFDLFRIGLGPSSSHTVGPMRAARAFIQGARDKLGLVARLEVRLYGSLAWTGRGHGTDVAALAGLAGLEPASADPDAVRGLPAEIRRTGALVLENGISIPFDIDTDIVFDRVTRLNTHPNTMRFRLEDHDGGVLHEETWFSLGGGFVVRAGDPPDQADQAHPLPFPFRNARDILDSCAEQGLSLAALQFANECAIRSPSEVRAHIAEVCATMEACIDHGLRTEGELPGGLNVKRRALKLAARMEEKRAQAGGNPNEAMDRASLWAIAVNEENAAGGRVVTAPTNGAAGVVPAVLRYMRSYYPGADSDWDEKFLLAAAAIGALAKTNASISGAEVGCQGEVGVACAMAAAGLASALGGTPEQVENAAEIGLEHHLGMTCDPIGGLVQIPCIERNAMGAIKAINAASLALSGDGTHRVSLDEVVATMRQTGLDMHDKYKETAQGGLAVHVTEC